MSVDRLGIGSFAFRYQVGIEGCIPCNPFTPFDFICAVETLGLKRLQLCENIKYAEYGADEIKRMADMARQKDITVELGLYGATPENLDRHIELAKIFDCRFIRVVIGELSGDKWTTVAAAGESIRNVLDKLRRNNITLGIENHFDITTEQIVSIIKDIDDPHVGAVLDTTNSIGFIEKPERSLELMLPYIKSVHLKDYIMQRAEASIVMSGRILGCGLLDVPGFLKKITEAAPFASVIIEQTIRRREGATPEEAALEEKQQITECVQYAKSILITEG